jgi:hypothetical protein
MTERIDQLIASKEGLDPDQLAALDDDDRQDALSRALDPSDPNRVRALELVAHSDPAEIVQAAGALLADPAVDAEILAAGVLLAATAGELATLVIQGAAAATDPTVAFAAWRAAQQIGSGNDLPLLQNLASAAGGIVGDQAAFSLSVIAYRAGVGGFELPVPASDSLLEIASTAATTTIDVSAAGSEDFALLMQLSGAELYGVSVTQETSTAIDCGGQHMLVALDSSFVAAAPDRLTQGPALAGLIALLDPLGTGYSVSSLILSWPADTGFNVAAHRPDGPQLYYGLGEVTADTASVSLRAVGRQGAVPITASASLTAAGLELTEASSAVDSLEARVPEPE